MRTGFAVRAMVVAVASLWAASAVAADLPKATQALLKKAGFDASILSGLDHELVMPQAWIDGVKREPELKILAAWDPKQFREMSAPFRERYPYVKVNYTRGGLLERGNKALMAYQSGRYIADIITSASNVWIDFKEIDGLVDLRTLPNFALLPPENRDDHTGLWIGQKITFRCMAYNTRLVPKEHLPKTWDNLTTDPFWRNGKLAVPDRPSLWLSMLWDAKGPEWATSFMTKMFTEVKPQLRKEGSSAVVGLTAAGETPAFIGAAEYRVKEYAEKGAPVSLHCPEPIPVGVSQLMMLKGSPAPNGAAMFLNWFLSREGQLAQYAGDWSLPVHKDLEKDPRFLPFPDEVVGKSLAVRDEERIRSEYPKMMAVYEPLWKAAGGGALPTDGE
ncbi:MAG TPA: extracellular solute-binding protein [Alphaproteobacteria bacterium]|nr:extracellular solute-binding protein [Alphaproteobacteria bacterium]